MQKNKIFYFLIILTLLLTTYIGFIFEEKINLEILIKKIKEINIFLLFFYSAILFLIQKKYKIKEIKIILVLVFLTIFLKKFYLSFFIVIISSFVKKEIRLKQLFFILCFFYLSILILNYLGYLEFNNIRFGVSEYGDLKISRNPLGFSHPNVTMSLLLPIFSILYYLYYPEYKKIVLGIILIIGGIIFKLTFSRTTFLLIILFVILILIKDKYIEKLKFLFLIEGFLITFFTYYLSFYFKNTILNNLFSERLGLFYYYLKNYKIRLFGYGELVNSYRIYPLDNVYLKVLFENGIIGFGLLLMLIFIIMSILFRFKDYKAIRIFSIILIFGFMESVAFHYYYNIICFIISDYIFKNKNIIIYEKRKK